MTRTQTQAGELILKKCLEQLRALPPVQRGELLEKEVTVDDQRQFHFDAEVDVVFKTGGHTIYLVEAKNTFSRMQAEQAISWAQTLKGKFKKRPMLIMANYINPSLAELLKEHHVQFIDTSGNAFIEHPKGIFIWVLRNRPSDLHPRRAVGAAFRANGAKIVYVLLKEPGKADWKYRAIAQQAHVALGTVNRVLADLKALGFIEPIGPHQFKLTQKRRLLERWVESYSERLRPKLVLGTFRTSRLELSEVAKALRYKKRAWAVTGDVAADLLTSVLKGGRLVIMLDTEVSELVEALKLMPSRDGNLEVLHLFSRAALFEGLRARYPVAHPLLIYAELLHSGGDREREAAKLIYEQHIARLIEAA